MRLAPFILANLELILSEWDTFAHSLAAGRGMTKLALRDDAEAVLLAAARDRQVDQSIAQQRSKSKGRGSGGGAESDRLDNASTLHAVGRAGSGFDIAEVVSEYRALRASVLRLWRESQPAPDIHDIDDITRFNESIDQSLAQAVGSYTTRVDQSRRMFLAILSHDMRTPLACIRMATLLASRPGEPDSAQALSVIETNTEAVGRLVSDLMEFASTSISGAMPLSRSPVDLQRLCRQVFEGFRATHPERALHFHPNGDVTGDWDAARLHQVVANLLGNALQHGSADGPVELSVASDSSGVILRVHNEGTPIPPDLLPTIFDPLVRYATPTSTEHRVPGSVGLGLYIVREIVAAHDGTIDITSTAEEGTTFTVRLPRSIPAS